MIHLATIQVTIVHFSITVIVKVVIIVIVVELRGLYTTTLRSVPRRLPPRTVSRARRIF